MIITGELYYNLGSDKFIPIVIDNISVTLEDFFPIFLGPLRKGVFRSAYDNENVFIEEVARAIESKPKNPKPPLGNSGWESATDITIEPKSINFKYFVKKENINLLFNTTLKYCKENNIADFYSLKKQVLSLSFDNLLKLREKYETTFPAKDKKDLPPIMDEFIDFVRPIFLISYAGYLSANPDFTQQEGIMYDLLAIDEWRNRDGKSFKVIGYVPEMLVYVYHHIYGTLHIDNERLPEIIKLLKTKLPLSDKSNEYNYLHKIHDVSGWVASLGSDCFDSFKFLLDAYPRWQWLRLLFKTEDEYKRNLVSYQLIINLLDYFDYLEGNQFDGELRPDIPPSFVISDNKYQSYAVNYVMKNSEFFKKYLTEKNVSYKAAVTQWDKWRNVMYRFNKLQLGYYYLSENFIKNLLK